MNVVLVAGLQFGDEGKGATVDALVRRYGATLVVRYNGGPQAGHTVTDPSGVRHTFSQFGSGTLAGARTHLSSFMSIQPLALRTENSVLETIGVTDALERLTVDPWCPVVTPWHKWLNRQREVARGAARHGSCGMGVGALREDLDSNVDVIRATMLKEQHVVAPIAANIYDRLRKQCLSHGFAWDERLIPSPGSWAREASLAFQGVKLSDRPAMGDLVIFEGAQGVLLDERVGFHPHTTWSDCTFANAESLIGSWHLPLRSAPLRVGVARVFQTRHGAGPLPTEDIALGARFNRGERNGHDRWQGVFRYGHMDGVLLRYAIDRLGGINALSLTCLDRVNMQGNDYYWRIADAYQGGPEDDSLLARDHHGHVVNLVPQGSPAGQDDLRFAIEQCRPSYTRYGLPLAGISRALGNRAPWLWLLGNGPTADDRVWDGDWDSLRLDSVGPYAQATVTH